MRPHWCLRPHWGIYPSSFLCRHLLVSASLGHHSVASSCDKLTPFSVLTATQVAALLFN